MCKNANGINEQLDHTSELAVNILEQGTASKAIPAECGSI